MEPGTAFTAGILTGLMLGFASEIIADMALGFFHRKGDE